MTIERNEVNQLLEEKDQLITALTERLEMAAEQLDRMHRTGADRSMGGGNSSGGAAVPAELLEDQREMMENIQQMFGEWDEMPAATSLGRIETQISEVRDLIVQLSQAGVNVRGPVSAASPPANHVAAPGSDDLNGFELPADLMGDQPDSTPDSQVEATDQAVSEWDAIKAGLLGDEAAPAPEGSNPVADTPAPGAEAAEKTTPSFTPPQQDVPESEAPADVDLETANREQLCEAVVQRDDYISWLLSQLFAQKHPDFDWDNLPEVPEELQHRLHHLETQLEAKLRMAEVSCAMDRARIGRDEARIKQVEQQAQRLLKRLGVNENDVQSQLEQPRREAPQAADDQASSGKWRRLLGLGDGDE